MTINDIKTMAELKNKAQKTILDSVDSIIEVLQAFDGKSISGNKKRIMDSINAICPDLHASIEKDDWHTTLKIHLYPRERGFKLEDSNCWQHIESSFLVLWESFRDNILDFNVIKIRMEQTRNQYETYYNRTSTTAENIESIAEQVKELTEKLYKIRYNTDSELTEAFNIRY